MKLKETIFYNSVDGTLVNGIFRAINMIKNDIPFLIDGNYKTLDEDYYFSHSGEKSTSITFNKLYDLFKNENDIVRKQKTIPIIARMIINRYLDNWLKIYDAYFNTDYKPLENYSMIEEENYTGKDATNTDLQTTNNGSSGSNVYGFNTTALDGVKYDKTINDNTQDLKGDKDNNFTDKTFNKTLTRSGNIGVTTSQQMLESELNLRKYDFYQQVYKDVDKILCSYIYDI